MASWGWGCAKLEQSGQVAQLAQDIPSREDDGKMSKGGGPQPSQLQFFFFC